MPSKRVIGHRYTPTNSGMLSILWSNYREFPCVDLTAKVHSMAETMAQLHEKEVSRRESFMKEHGQHLPKVILLAP